MMDKSKQSRFSPEQIEVIKIGIALRHPANQGADEINIEDITLSSAPSATSKPYQKNVAVPQNDTENDYICSEKFPLEKNSFMESISSKLKKEELETFRTLMELSSCCDRIEKDFLSQMKFHINVITAAARGKLKETAHSLILHDLLHHKIILKSFLETIVGIPAESFSPDNIDYPDHNRIDLSLRSDDRFLIIENKVNGAEEQLGQICRYYDFARQCIGSDKKQIFILYLNPSGYETPSLYSRSWNGCGDEDDSQTVPLDKITVKDFNHDIIRWLKTLTENYSELFKEEPFLESAVCQYLDYLEEKFQTKDKYKELHNMTENEIKKELGLSDTLSIEEQISILEDRKAQLQALVPPMDRMVTELKRQQWQNLVSDVTAALQARFGDKVTLQIMDLKIPECGFDVDYEGHLFTVSIVYWTNDKPYWRIFSETDMPEVAKSAIAALLQGNFKDVTRDDKDHNWTFYKTTSMENVQLRLGKLLSLFISSPKFKVK